MAHKTLPPPPPRTASLDALTDTPKKEAKKPWSKPTIRTMDDVVTVESAATQADAENATYRPS